MNDDIVLQAEGVSKKFCRSLKRSMWYAGLDVARDVAGIDYAHDQLRPAEFWAVNDISFELRRGECLGIVGHNGAGKSTLLKMLNGIVKPDRGRIEYQGRLEALLEVAAGFHPQLTGRENVYVIGAILGMSRRAIDAKFERIAAFADIDDFLDTPVKFYSSGMKVRLGMAVSLHTDPSILLVDEVFAVGDISFRAKCFNRIGELRQLGVSFLLVSHNPSLIGGYSNQVMVLDHGKIVALGEPESALDTYLDIMRSRQLQAGKLDAYSADTPNGTGRIRIVNFYFTNAVGARVQSISAGEPLKLSFEYEADQDFQDIEVNARIVTPADQVFLRLSNKLTGTRIDVTKGAGVVELSLPCLPANSSYLSLDVSIWSESRHELFDSCKDMHLKVEGCSRSNGIAWVDCEYKVKSALADRFELSPKK